MPKYDYEYYSGAESDQFRFLRIPKVFFEDSDYEDLGLAEYVWVNHFFCVLDGYWLRTPPLTEPVRNAAA